MTVHGSWTVDRLVEAYTHHQRRTRGLRPQTLRNRAWLVRMLVRVALGTDPMAALRRCVKDPAPQPLRFTATDRLLDFLEALGSPLTMRSTAARNRPGPRGPPSQLSIVLNSA